jgi:hypothetical protein
MAGRPSVIDIVTAGNDTSFPSTDENISAIKILVTDIANRLDSLEKQVSKIPENAAASDARLKRLFDFTAIGRSGPSLNLMVETIFNKLGCQ